jgi:hypothetical protein
VTFLDRVNHGRKYAYRYLKYHLKRPSVPEARDILDGRTAVVVGSAPNSTRPEGWNANFRVITINASQAAAAGWLDERPAITLMMFNQIEGQNPTAKEVRRVLQSKSTGKLILLLWRHDLQRLKQGLAAFGYAYDELSVMSRYQRMALMYACLGKLDLDLDLSTRWSNGIVGTAFALQSGAKRVILSGINPQSTGHAYNSLGLNRQHVSADLDALHALVGQGKPVFTADTEVAKSTGLPLWRGE